VLYPRRFFESLGEYAEFTMVIHGMRNNKNGALEKFKIAQRRLSKLGYNYPLVGFSYDSNVKGTQYKSSETKATHTARIIAKKNSSNLARFILHFKRNNPDTNIRLIGHSLGTELMLYTLEKLKHRKNIIKSAYLFGSSIPEDLIKSHKFRKILQKTINDKIVNYYSTNDQVLKYAITSKLVKNPIGYYGVKQQMPPKYFQKFMKVKNHRFASYAGMLRSFP
jgi:esterase/lipase superfamily enzyme